jgi:hypothetical protein
MTDGAPAFPVRWGERRAWSAHGARGLRWGALPRELGARLPAWIERGELAGDEELKPGTVVRLGGLVAKLFPPRSALARRLRGSSSRREAERSLALAPLLAPRPLLALDGVGARRTRALLVSEFMEGAHLDELWGRDARAAQALPIFLHALESHGHYHGDLHPRNLLWRTDQWALLDLGSLRSGLHLLRARALSDATWARLLVHLADEPGLARAWRSYAALAGRDEDMDAGWQRVLRRAERLLATRTAPPPRGSWTSS